MSLFQRLFGPKIIKGGIEIYDKNDTGGAGTNFKYKGSFGLSAVDDKFMEPGFRPVSLLSTTHKDSKKDKTLVESIKLSEFNPPVPVSRGNESIKPEQVQPPQIIASTLADPDFLPACSDRSNMPLADAHKPAFDPSKVSAAVDNDQVTRIVYNSLMQQNSKLFHLVKYP